MTGTFCPLPILLAVREMLQLRAGERLEIVGDDPAILDDMPIWCERAGHRLIEITERQGKITSVVEKGGGRPAPRRRRSPAPGRRGGKNAGGERRRRGG